MEVEENDLSFLFGFFSFWHFVYRFCRGQQKYEYLEERGKMRFHLISSDMLQISRVSLGFLGFFLFHENILFCHNSQNRWNFTVRLSEYFIEIQKICLHCIKHGDPHFTSLQTSLMVPEVTPQLPVGLLLSLYFIWYLNYPVLSRVS